MSRLELSCRPALKERYLGVKFEETRITIEMLDTREMRTLAGVRVHKFEHTLLQHAHNLLIPH